MTIANGTLPTDARSAALHYLSDGLAPIPLPARSKNPGYAGWETLRVTADTIDQHFPPGRVCNVGVLNGTPSGNIADVDLDVNEAIQAAAILLPDTGWRFGRAGKQSSHQIYRTDRAINTAQDAYEDLDGTMLLELRGTGGLTVFPPSLHDKTGERVTWERFDSPAEMPLKDLQCAVGEVAAATILARHWPAKGRRDRAAMALTGGLTRAAWDEDHISRFIVATVRAAGDDEVKMRSTKGQRTADRIENGEPTLGWPALAKALGDNGNKVVDRVFEWLGITTDSRRDDAPLPEPEPWPEPPADEAFHGLAGRIVSAIEPASEANKAALLIQTIVAFGNLIGRTAYFTVEADRHHGNEFAVLVGRTSKARKGTSWGQVYRLFREAEEIWASERVQTGLSSGEGLIWAVRDPIKKRERIKERGQPVRYEEVEGDPGISDKRLLVYEPEFANVLKQTERQGNTLSAVLRQAWDGNDLRTLTKNTPARATDAHISLIGHITADELRRYLTATETANGYGNRHLWICTDRSKLLPEGGRVDPAMWDSLRSELAEAIAFARTVGGIARDDEARAIWCSVYGDLSEGKAGLGGALRARGEAHVMRLAMVFALMDRSVVIQAPHLMAALALWDYSERSVKYIFGDELGDPIADELLRLIRRCSEGMTRTEMMDYFGRHIPSNRLGHALGSLLQSGLVKRQRQETSGRPAERWFATKTASGT